MFRVCRRSECRRPSGLSSIVCCLAMFVTVMMPDRSAADPQTPDEIDIESAAGRTRLRYAGRTFDAWREQLLNDLDPKTCMQAMDPIVAFGKKGYEEEAISALAEMLHDDRMDVAMEASQGLGQLGPRAVGALIDGLADARPQVRMRAANSLGRLKSEARPASKALVQLLNDENNQVRAAATQSLVIVAADDEALKDVFQRLAASDEVVVRRALVDGLSTNPPGGGPLLKLLIESAYDNDSLVRSATGPALAQNGPPEKPVIDALNQLLRDSDPRTWQSTFSALGNSGNSATKVAVLAGIVNSPEEFAMLRQQGYLARAVSLLGGARDQAEVAVGALLTVVDKKNNEAWDPALAATAIDALGRIGSPAKRTIPSLERWIFEEPQIVLANGDTLDKHARRALRRIVDAKASTGDSQ